MEGTEKTISELEDRTIEISQSEQQLSEVLCGQITNSPRLQCKNIFSVLYLSTATWLGL